MIEWPKNLSSFTANYSYIQNASEGWLSPLVVFSFFFVAFFYSMYLGKSLEEGIFIASIPSTIMALLFYSAQLINLNIIVVFVIIMGLSGIYLKTMRD